MGSNIRQKRKGRSSRSVVRQSNSRKRPVNPTGNAIVAENWDKKQTLSQNYRRLGLMNRLQKPAGGTEKLGTDVLTSRQMHKKATSAAKAAARADPLRIDGGAGLMQAMQATAGGSVSEVRVERDASGKIVRVVSGGDLNPLGDLLNGLDEWEGIDDGPGAAEEAAPTDKKEKAPTPVVAALEALASKPVGPRHVRHQSEGERVWLQTLVDHYGTLTPDDDTLSKMAHDRRRNPMQRTAADLGRRIAAFRATGGALSA